MDFFKSSWIHVFVTVDTLNKIFERKYRINASTNYCYFKCKKYTLYSLCILYGGMLLFAFDARLHDTLSFVV